MILSSCCRRAVVFLTTTTLILCRLLYVSQPSRLWLQQNTRTNKENTNNKSITTTTTKVFVSYMYCEEGKRSDSLKNLDFFLRHGATVPNSNNELTIDYGLTVNGKCTHLQCISPSDFTMPNRHGETPSRFIIVRRENTGFDFGAHAAMLNHLEDDLKQYPSAKEHQQTIYEKYDAFIFLNDGVIGPIVPSYMPQNWHWVSAFVDRLTLESNAARDSNFNKNNNSNTIILPVGLVGTSIVCLSEMDLGGLGPKVEGFAFGVSSKALEIVRTHGTSFRQHANKKDAILSGEYNLTTVVFNHGMTVDSLLSAYQGGVNWRNSKNWNCNNQIHPSRSGSYFGISIHPMEVLFHKCSWAGLAPVMKEELNMHMKFANEAL